MRKSLLIVIDYQNDFVNGSLGFESASKLEDKIIDLVDKKEKEGFEVVFTKDIHEDNYLDTVEGKNLPIPHCIKGSKGEQIYGKLKEVASRHLIFEKETFGSLELANYIAKGDYKDIILCGIDTSICVLSNAILAKAASPSSNIFIASSCSGSGDLEAEKIAYKALERVQIHKL